MYQVRCRCSAYTSGTATVSMIASQGSNEQQVTTGIAQSAVSASQLGQIVMGNVTTAAPAYTTAQSNPLSLTTAGSIRADINSIIGTTAVAASAGVLKTGISGATGVTLDSASAAAFPTNMLAISGKAQNVNPTAVANAQAVAIATDLAGRVITTPFAYRTLVSHVSATVAVNTISTLVAAGAAGVFRDIFKIVVTTLGAAANTLTFTDGTNSFILDYPNQALAPATPLVLDFSAAPLRATTAATVWQVTQSLATQCRYLTQYVERIA
jgi:hypothetical protein